MILLGCAHHTLQRVKRKSSSKSAFRPVCTRGPSAEGRNWVFMPCSNLRPSFQVDDPTSNCRWSGCHMCASVLRVWPTCKDASACCKARPTAHGRQFTSQSSSTTSACQGKSVHSNSCAAPMKPEQSNLTRLSASVAASNLLHHIESHHHDDTNDKHRSSCGAALCGRNTLEQNKVFIRVCRYKQGA